MRARIDAAARPADDRVGVAGVQLGRRTSGGLCLYEPRSGRTTGRSLRERSGARKFASGGLDGRQRPQARVRVEVTLPGQGIDDHSREALRDLPAARDPALTARLLDDVRRGETAARAEPALVAGFRSRPSHDGAASLAEVVGPDMLLAAWPEPDPPAVIEPEPTAPRLVDHRPTTVRFSSRTCERVELGHLAYA